MNVAHGKNSPAGAYPYGCMWVAQADGSTIRVQTCSDAHSRIRKALKRALKLAAATLIVSGTLLVAPSYATTSAYATPAPIPTMSFNPDADLDASYVDVAPNPATQVDTITNFPGGLSLTMETGQVLTCRDFETIPTQECNSADTVQHYLHAFTPRS
jgi:hypothetical protein